MSEVSLHQIAVVVIGRNEGEGLRRCLGSIDERVAAIVYVDSGSTDGSVALAESMGAQVVELDAAVPFTAARARNIGIAHVGRLASDVAFVQVVDGDCELIGTWLERALEVIVQHPKTAIVCGRRRERFPHTSMYNRLTDMEWDTPVGEAIECGGDALLRLEAFEAVSGYNASLIAGEEPELCLRLRQAGWTIRRIAAEMTLHDVRMTRFGQWWTRTVRSGYAFAESRALHGSSRERYCVHQVRSIIEWGALLPLAAIALIWFTWGASLLLLAGYVMLWRRVRAHRIDHGDTPALAGFYARYVVIGKLAQLVGCFRYWIGQLMGRQASLIEYKNGTALSEVRNETKQPGLTAPAGRPS